MHPVGPGQVVEQVVDAAAPGLQARGQFGEEQRGADAVLVAHLRRVDAVAERLLVAVAQPRHPGDPLETGQGLLVTHPGRPAHRGEQPRGDDRVGEHALRRVGQHPGRRTLGEQVRPEQGTDLVTAQHPPATGARHRGRTAVGIRVVGDDDVRSGLLRELDGGVDRARLLGVGEGHRREGRVGLGLALHDVGRREPGPLEGGQHGLGADPVQRGVHDRQLGRGAVLDHGGGVTQVVLPHVVAEGLPAVVGPCHARHRRDLRDLLGDEGVDRRDDL